MAELNNAASDQFMGEEERLRYLQFVQAAATHALVYAASVYAYAKQSAGPLKPGVEAAEGTVKTVVGPVYDKFQGFPLELLRFLDKKVGSSVEKINERVPAVVKEAPNLARSMADQVHQTGMVNTAASLARNTIARAEPVAKDLYTKYQPVAKELYDKYEPDVERHAAATWRALNRLPLVPQVAGIVVPTAATLSEKYNGAVSVGAERGYTVANYLPLVPTERIARVFGDEVAVSVTGPEMETMEPVVVAAQ